MPQPNLNQIAKMAQKMQADMAAAQEQLASEEVQASVGGGMVTVTLTGALEITAITIAPDVIDPEDAELLQDMVLAAVNQALTQAQELAAQRMGSVTGGLGGGAGGLGGLLGM